MHEIVRPALSRRDLLASAALLGAGAAIGSSAAAQPSLQAPTAPIPVAVLLDLGANVMDFCGPWEVFQDAPMARVPGFELFTVAPQRTPVETSGRMQVLPRYTLDNAPDARIILVPTQSNGLDGSTSAPKADWLRERFPHVDLILSVCAGAFLPARAGLLDGLEATTHHLFFEDFRRRFPNVRWVRDRRFVEHPKLITAGGISSGIDAALRVFERYYGRPAASSVADYMEYRSAAWQV